MPKWLIEQAQARVDEANYSASQIDSGELENKLYVMSTRLEENASKLQSFAPFRYESYRDKAKEILNLQKQLGASRQAYEDALKAVVDFDWSTSGV